MVYLQMGYLSENYRTFLQLAPLTHLQLSKIYQNG